MNMMMIHTEIPRRNCTKIGACLDHSILFSADIDLLKSIDSSKYGVILAGALLIGCGGGAGARPVGI